MHGFSALESINEKLNEELASQEEDENEDEDGFDHVLKDAEHLSDNQQQREPKQCSSENDQSQRSQNVDKTQHEGGENADSGDQQKKISDEKMQKEVSDKILRSFYNSKYPEVTQQPSETPDVFQTLSD
jgi:hypothetical protein